MPTAADSRDALNQFTETGEPPDSRLADAASGIRIFNNLWEADKVSSYNRSRIQAMVDGEAPFSQAAIRKSGNAGRCNLNFGEGRAVIASQLASYSDLLESVGCLFKMELPESFDEAERPEIEDVIAEEFDRLVRHDWDEFHRTWDVLSSQFVTHGVGLVYWPDDQDWKFRSGGWDDFVIPRDTEASEESIDVLVILRSYTPTQLWKKIKNEKQATKLKWNVAAVKKELVRATKDGKAREGEWQKDWATLQRRLKNNDSEVSYSGSAKVELLHFLVREYDGSISHYIVPNCAEKEAEFLYEKRNALESSKQGFVLFTNGIGNGFYHSIRGQGFDIYAAIQEMNKLRCRTVDQAMLAGTLILQPQDTMELEKPPLVVNGLVAYLDPNIEVIPNGLDNRSEELTALGREMSLLVQNNTGSFRARWDKPTQKTRYELQAQQDLESRLSASQSNLFYRSLDKVSDESFRRVKAIGEKSRNYPEVTKFFERCMERGVTPDMVKLVVRCEARRAIGLGSPGQRQNAFAILSEMQGSFDERGRKLLVRDRIASIPGLGRNYADRYAPRDEGARPVLDEQFAQLENAALKAGQPIARIEGQNDVVHANGHLPAIIEEIKGLEQMRSGAEAIDPEVVLPKLRFLDAAISHTNEHVEQLANNPLAAPQYGAFRKALQEVSAIFATFVRQVNKIMQKQQEENAAQPQPDDEMTRKIEEFQQKLQMLWEAHKARLQMTAEKVQQDLTIGKMKADLALSTAAKKARMKMESDRAKQKPVTVQR